MVSSLFIAPILKAPICNSLYCSKIHTNTFRIVNPTLNLPLSSPNLRFAPVQISTSHSNYSPSDGKEDEEEYQEGLVRDLRVPENWWVPSKALEESEWLRVNLHKWLDDEYCPEATNVEISTVAAQSYYQSLVQKQTDLGEILLRMAGELESISYQESFHGAFSSANAAVSLIIQRIEQD